ncbi:hypothetical protein ACQSDJ_03885 [Salmonella enterica]|uniref:hypothetical protein n=1 Tax=Salmonella enterica TaxID=28901 RepID=UPI003D321A8F
MEVYTVTPPVVLTISNDATEEFLKKAVGNIKKHIQYMIDYAFDDFTQHSEEKKYIDALITKVIDNTKADFEGEVMSKKLKVCDVYFDEVSVNLRKLYMVFIIHWNE